MSSRASLIVSAFELSSNLYHGTSTSNDSHGIFPANARRTIIHFIRRHVHTENLIHNPNQSKNRAKEKRR